MMGGLFEPWRALCRQAENICCLTGMFVCAGGGATRDIHTMVKGAEVTDSTQQTLISLFFPLSFGL